MSKLFFNERKKLISDAIDGLGVKKLNMDKLQEVAEASCAEGETIHNMPFEVTAGAVLSAILTANELGK